jgi:glycosyltransferase involved in cell wall biosynthesis
MIRQKVKLCFILSHLPQGGAERQTVNLIRKLNPEEFDVTLVLYANQEIFYKEILQLPVRIFSSPAYSKCKLIKNLKGAIFLRKILSRHQFDLIHTLLFHNGLWIRLLAPERYSGRIIYSIRNSLEQSSFIERSIEKFLHSRSITVTNSHFVLDQYKKIVRNCSSESCLTIYNGIEIEKFRTDEAPIVSDPIVIGTVGRQTPLKNQIQILRVIKHLSNEYPINAFIIGDSDQGSFEINYDYVRENKLDDKVKIMDSQGEIEYYYKMFNIFVLSSIHESCPNSLLEAMLARCLCIVSRGSNRDKFIIEGYNGFEYDGTDQDLMDKIRIVINMLGSENARVIQKNAQDYVSRNFSMEKMTDRYLELYKSLIKPGKLY